MLPQSTHPVARSPLTHWIRDLLNRPSTPELTSPALRLCHRQPTIVPAARTLGLRSLVIADSQA
jgi:hypothetical protein